MEERTAVKIARIDENVKRLLESLPEIKKLEEQAATNTSEHRTAKWLMSILAIPLIGWLLKKIGLDFT